MKYIKLYDDQDTAVDQVVETPVVILQKDKNKILPIPTSAGEKVKIIKDSVNDLVINYKKQEKPLIILTYSDGTSDKFNNTEMTWDLIRDKTNEYSNNETLIKAELNEGVTSIGICAFRTCTNLVYVKLPSSLINIGISAFQHSEKLEIISLPENNNLQTIGTCAFEACAITSFIIPKGVTTINVGTFYSCSKLESLTIPNTIVNFPTAGGMPIMYGCSNLHNIYCNSINEPCSVADYTFNLFGSSAPEGFIGTLHVSNGGSVSTYPTWMNSNNLGDASRNGTWIVIDDL